MRDSAEETKRKALHNDVTRVFDDTRGLCSLFLQGKVTDPDAVKRAPHTVPHTDPCMHEISVPGSSREPNARGATEE